MALGALAYTKGLILGSILSRGRWAVIGWESQPETWSRDHDAHLWLVQDESQERAELLPLHQHLALHPAQQLLPPLHPAKSGEVQASAWEVFNWNIYSSITTPPTPTGPGARGRRPSTARRPWRGSWGRCGSPSWPTHGTSTLAIYTLSTHYLHITH